MLASNWPYILLPKSKSQEERQVLNMKKMKYNVGTAKPNTQN